MNKTEQGVLQQSELTPLFIHILLLLTFLFSPHASAEPSPERNPAHEIDTAKHQVLIVYSPDSKLHTDIIQKLSDEIELNHSDIIISKIKPEKIISSADDNNDLIIAIGRTGMQSAETNYPKTNKLFISTDPNKYQLDPIKNKNDAILYMTQTYCRQIRFIKLLNSQWKTISVLSSQQKPIDNTALQQCANSYDVKVYRVSITADKNLTDKVKHALHHSDVLLALPDSNIYNRKTVKNILLTSYRHRKPVIAFSKNFVNAGALASIHSNTEQIAQSASKLIEQYFDSDMQFENSTNHPDKFVIDINRQVFRALDIVMPDTNKLKQSLQNNAGELP